MSKLWSPEQTEFCNRMIWKYVRSYTAEKNIQVSADRLEDYVQSVWLSLSEFKWKHPDREITAGLIERMVKTTFIDQIRKDVRDTSDNIDDLTNREDDPDTGDALTSHSSDVYKATELKSLLNDLPDKFDPDYELQRKYLMWFLEKEGIEDFGIHPEVTKDQDGYTDNALARYLGFPGTSSSRYKRFKSDMQNLIRTYYGRKS